MAHDTQATPPPVPPDEEITEAEWKRTFEELNPTEKAFLFGFWLGRAQSSPIDFPEISSEVETDTVWEIRQRVRAEQKEAERIASAE